ncbi:MAG TPA: cache domain-containing protein [Candidatus Polarisedimenticolaceae bacterium]|nr:cache domain-containing protein [Candidatus Polarisedimenticolaceae bacterium]
MRRFAISLALAVAVAMIVTASMPARAQMQDQHPYGTGPEAKAMLEKAVAALKQNKEKALEMFNKGEGGFRDRDLYVFCADATDGKLTAHPYLKGEPLQDIVGKKGFPLGKAIMDTAVEGKIQEVTYWWPRPGGDKPLEKHTYFTKVVGQNCGVGFYKD